MSFKQLLIFLTLTFLVSIQYAYGASFNTTTSGDWEDNATWVGTAPGGTHGGNSISINSGDFVVRNGDLTFNSGASALIMYDTLVILGDFTVDNASASITMTWAAGAVLLVVGDFTVESDLTVPINTQLIVTGEFNSDANNWLGQDSAVYIYDDTPDLSTGLTAPQTEDDLTPSLEGLVARFFSGCPTFTDLSDQSACDSIQLPTITGSSLTGNEKYYTTSQGLGTEYNVGDYYKTVGSTTIYIFDTTGACTEEDTIGITITAGAGLDVSDLADQTACDSFLLPTIAGTNLSGSEAYYSGTGATGTSYNAGDYLYEAGTYYIYDINGGCSDEESFTLTVNRPNLSRDTVYFNDGSSVTDFLLDASNSRGTTGTSVYFNGGATADMHLFMYFDSVDLADVGDSIILRVRHWAGNGASGLNTSNASAHAFRYGLFNNGGTQVAHISGESNASFNGYTGYYGSFAVLTATSNPTIYQRATSNNLILANGGTSLGSGTQDNNMTGGVYRTLTMTISRTADGINIRGTQTGTNGTFDFSVNDNTSPETAFNTFVMSWDDTPNLMDWGYIDDVLVEKVEAVPPSTTWVNEQTTVCTSESGILYQVPSNLGTYTWSITDNGTFESGGAPSDDSVVVKWDAATTSDSVSVLVTDGNGCAVNEAYVSKVASVTVGPDVIDLIDTTVCDSLFLPTIGGSNLTGSEAYYTGSGGTGTSFNAGDYIYENNTFYIYDVNGGCSDEESFDLTVQLSNYTLDTVFKDTVGSSTWRDNELRTDAATTLVGGSAIQTFAGDFSFDTEDMHVYFYFDSVTLENVGDTIRLFIKRFDGESGVIEGFDGANTTDKSIRIGLFNNGGTEVADEGGESNAGFANYTGYYGAFSGDADNDVAIYQRATSDNSLILANAGTSLGTGTQTSDFTSDEEERDFYFLIIRTMAGINIRMYVENSDNGNFDITVSDNTSPEYSFNTLVMSWDDTPHLLNFVYFREIRVDHIHGPTPTSSFAAEVNTVCAGDAGSVYTVESGFDGYAWTAPDNGSFSSGGGGSDNTATVSWNEQVSGIDTVKVSVTDPNGCEVVVGGYVSEVTVNRQPYPVLLDDVDGDRSCLGQSIDFIAIDTNNNNITNGNFSNGTSGWTYTQPAGTGSGSVSGGEYHVSITDGGPNANDIRIHQDGISMEAGTEYIISFKARAASDRQMLLRIIDRDNGNAFLLPSALSFNLTSSDSIYYSVIPASATVNSTNIRYQFRVGGDNSDVFLDDIYVTEHYGDTYNFRINASSVQSSTDSLYTNTTISNGDQVKVIITTSNACVDSSSATTFTVDSPVSITDLQDTTVCDSLLLPSIGGTGLTGSEAYYTDKGGNGTSFNAGDYLYENNTFYIYDVNGACTAEQAFNLTVNLSNYTLDTVFKDTVSSSTWRDNQLRADDASVTIGGTGSEVFVGNLGFNTEDMHLYFYFDSVTLDQVGDSVKLFIRRFDGEVGEPEGFDGANTTDKSIRIGLFNNGGTEVADEGGESNAGFANYTGYYGAFSADADNDPAIFQRATSDNSLILANAGTSLGVGTQDSDFTSIEERRDFHFIITKTMAGINIRMIIDDATNGSLDMTVSDNTSPELSFNTLVMSWDDTPHLINFVYIQEIRVEYIHGPTPISSWEAEVNSVCAGETGSVYTIGSEFGTYTWTAPNNGTFSSGGGISDNTATVSWNEQVSGTDSVKVSILDPKGCEVLADGYESEVTINRQPYPVLLDDVSSDEICAGQGVDFIAIDTNNNLIVNGDFSNGTSDWDYIQDNTGSGSGSVSGGEYHVSITNGGVNPTDIRLRQQGYSMEAGKEYIVSFKARASADRAIRLRVRDNDAASFVTSAVTFNLTTSDSVYFTIITASESVNSTDIRYSLRLGSDNNDVYFDDFRVTEHYGDTYNFRINASSVQSSTDSLYTSTTLADNDEAKVIITTSNACVDSSAATTFAVNALPVPTFTSEVTTTCVGMTNDTYTTQGGQSNYIWDVSAGGSIVSGGGTGDNTVDIDWDTAGAQTVGIFYTDGNGCTNDPEVESSVTVREAPTTGSVFHLPNM